MMNLSNDKNKPVIKNYELDIEVEMNKSAHSSQSFENFIVGDSNRFAAFTAEKASEMIGGYYSPLFICGGHGLGKTHLLRAIQNDVLQRKPEARVIYIDSETFKRELQDSISDMANELHVSFFGADIFLFDDISRLEGMNYAQSVLESVLDALAEEGRQLVITSSKPLDKIADLSDRLRSRLQSGVTAEIYAPDWITRKKIIKYKAQALNLDFIEDDCVDYISQRCTSNVNEIEGALKTMAAKFAMEESAPQKGNR